MYCQILESIRFTKNSDIIKKFERYTRSVFQGREMDLLFHFPLPILKFTSKEPCQTKQDSRNRTHLCIRQIIFISK